MSRWYFQPIFDSYVFVFVLAAALMLLLLVRPAYRPLSAKRRSLLTSLRAAVLLFVVIAMLRPTHVSSTSRPQPSTLIVLMDRSRSMSIADVAGEKTRWQAQRDVLSASLPALRELAEDVEVLMYSFDAKAHALPFVDGDVQWEREPTGDESDIGTSLDEVIRRSENKRLAAVVLLSDGAQRAVSPSVDITQPARELGRLGYPLYTIAFGQSSDNTQARDVAVEQLPDQYTVFVKNELSIRGRVRLRGYVNQDIPVELMVESADGKVETFGPLLVKADQDDHQTSIEFTYTPQAAGQYKATVQVPEQPGELVTENNRLSAFVTVLEGGLRILYLDGNVAWPEQKYINRSVDSSPDMQMDFQWIDPRQRANWPIDLNGMLSGHQYDVFLVGDLDSAALGEVGCAELAKQVDFGKGLMMIGGYHSFGPGGYRDTKLVEVLPVKMGRFERQQYDEGVRTELHVDGPLVMLPAQPHFITRLAPAADNVAAWRRLPPLVGANRIVPKDNAWVLAQSPREDPLLVAQEYGRGRVLAMAGDSTWRWYRRGFQREHKRFWRQAILWLARKDESMRDGVWIKLDQRRLHPGTRVVFSAGANSPDGDPLDDVTFSASMVRPDGSEQPVVLTRDGTDWAGSEKMTDLPGEYSIRVECNRQQNRIGEANAQFVVMDQDLELTDPAANPQQMTRLARLTSEAGGMAIAPEQLPGLLRRIKQEPPKLEVEIHSKWQLADTAWDAWLFFLAIIGLLGMEWYFRKKWKLV